jgi:Divergent InlB B-repeat domain/FG-GAP-like repeat
MLRWIVIGLVALATLFFAQPDQAQAAVEEYLGTNHRQDGILDFNGDGKSDIFRTDGTSWYVSYGGTSTWVQLRYSPWNVSDGLCFGDFNGDGVTDVFGAGGAGWGVAYGGTSGWSQVNTYTVTPPNIALGDFNNDGVTDVFYPNGTTWNVSYGGTSAWTQINTSGYRLDDLALADLNGDGKTDVIRVTPPSGSGLLFQTGKWYVSYAGTGSWTQIQTSDYGKLGDYALMPEESDFGFADLDNGGGMDVFRATGTNFYISSAGTGNWRLISSEGEPHLLHFGDLDGNGLADVFKPTILTPGGWKVWFNYGTSMEVQYIYPTALPPAPPVITSNGGGSTAAISVVENQTVVTDVDATDANGDPLNYSIAGGVDRAKFSIDAATGVLSFLSAPDYENPTDANADNVYEVVVLVDDGFLYDAQTISVTVTHTPLTLTYAADPGGTIVGTSSQTVAYMADGSQVTAVPDTGYHFVSWSDGSVANPRVDTGVTANVNVTARFASDPTPTPTLTVTVPAGRAAYQSGDGSVGVYWTSDQALSVGEFGIWARSASGNWYVAQLLAASGGTSFNTSLPLSGVPAGWYQAIVAYRPTVGSGSWMSFATSPGVFSIDGTAINANITTPVGQTDYVSSQSFTAQWNTNASLSTGQFAVWVRHPDDTWYWMSPVVPANGGTNYSAPVSLSGVAPGLGYQLIVAYEAIPNTGLWMSWATSPGVFAVDMTSPSLTITQPSGAGSYTMAQSVSVSWNANTALPSGGQFAVWVRSAANGWYATTLVPTNGGSGYSTTVPLSGLPSGSGNQVIVAYRPVQGAGAFMSWATSPGSFTITP